ncbi:hypothetical protein WA158_001919 [Blastocystis sp. Blastoise]
MFSSSKPILNENIKNIWTFKHQYKRPFIRKSSQEITIQISTSEIDSATEEIKEFPFCVDEERNDDTNLQNNDQNTKDKSKIIENNSKTMNKQSNNENNPQLYWYLYEKVFKGIDIE